MQITIWGCRGSISAPGKETLRYGGESTCLEVTTDGGKTIIIDAGSGIRKLGTKLLKDASNTNFTFILTHAHWDHLAGFPFFRPAFSPAYTMNLCGGPDPQRSLLKFLQHQMDPPYFPVDMSAMRAKFTEGCRCGITKCTNTFPGVENSHKCEAIPLNHPDGGYGFKQTDSKGKTFVFLTDNEIQFHHENGRTREEYVAFCSNADLLFHDAHYTDEEYAKTKTWGHSTYKDAVDLAIDANVKKLGLFHHDPDRCDDDIDRYVARCVEYIKSKNSQLECFACAEGMTFNL